MNAWLDRLTADLLHLETDLRLALVALRRGQPHPRLSKLTWDRIDIRAHEARTLIRGAMPVPIALSTLRGQHARMTAALGLFSQHLVAMNDPHPTTAEAAIAAAAALLTELHEWHRRAEWTRATRAAGVRWPVPRLPIRAVIGLQAPEHGGNKQAGDLDHPAAGLRLIRQLAADRQLQLDLALPAPAELVDLRQLRLQLVA